MYQPRLIFTSLLIALLCLSLATPPASAKLIEHTKLTGEGAHAQWEHIEGDILNFVSVTVSTNTIKNKPGDTTFDPLAAVSIFRTNLVTGAVFISAVGITSDFQFTVSNQLDTAHLSVPTVIMEDGSCFCFFLATVNLTWTGTGELVKERSRLFEVQEDGLKFKAFFKGESRDATASGIVSGAPFVGIPPFNVPGPEENFTPRPSTIAVINDNKSGTLTIQTGGGQ